MNMLIIGNGFDLAHGRPTTYVDFLKFAESVMRIQTFTGGQTEFQASLSGLNAQVKEYVLNLHKDTAVSQVNGQIHTNNKTIQEIWNCLDKNVWYIYFRWIRANDLERGKNWVDFESEIREIIKFLDHQISDPYDCLPPAPRVFPDSTRKIEFFWSQLDFTDYNLRNHRSSSYHNTYFDLIEKTYQDLEKLIRCLEIYLDDCVAKLLVTQCSPDIKQLKCDSILSFNYTAIPTDIYPSLTNTHNIHGHAKADRPATENDMVLGVNEYWDGDDKNTHTNFNLYKKFVQRIIKETGIGYKKTLRVMLSEYKDSEHLHAKTKGYIGSRHNEVYIFGHSLDVTDGDVLREVIQTEGIVTTIFYKDKQQQANQVANLSKVLTQDELLERTLSTSPTIIFKQQADMEKL